MTAGSGAEEDVSEGKVAVDLYAVGEDEVVDVFILAMELVCDSLVVSVFSVWWL